VEVLPRAPESQGLSNDVDITTRVERLGWYLPAGWKVVAGTQLDESYTPKDAEQYTFEEFVDWQFGEWNMVVVVVSVYDDKGRCVSWACRKGIPLGMLPTGYFHPLSADRPYLEGVVDSAMFGAKGEILAMLNSLEAPDSGI
jgi:hypothetical protein